MWYGAPFSNGTRSAFPAAAGHVHAAVGAKRYALALQQRALLRREVFRSVEWIRLDRGTLTDDEALESMYRRIPQRLHGAAEELVRRWDEPRLPMPGAYALVEELSEGGYGTYLLTNASLRHKSYWPKQPVAKFFSGHIMLSADWQLLKPDGAFYRKALELFGLKAEECLFIDDFPMNVEAAVREGIPGLVFHGDFGLLRRDLRDLGIDVGETA